MDGKTFLAGCVVGAAVGAVSGAVLSPEAESTARAPARSASLERRVGALGEEVTRLVRSVRALVAKLETAPRGSSNPTAHDKDGTGPSVAPRDVPDRRVASDSEIAHLANQPTKTDALAKIGSDHADSLSSPGTWGIVSKDLERKYLFHTYKDILRAFGHPDGVRTTQRGATLTYMLPVPNTRNRFHITFTFVDSLVMKAHASCSAFQAGR